MADPAVDAAIDEMFGRRKVAAPPHSAIGDRDPAVDGAIDDMLGRKPRGIGPTAIERRPEGSYAKPEILESEPGVDIVRSRAARMDWVLRDESKFYAPYSAHALASFPTKPLDRVRVFAERMFPDIPIERAMGRFGVKDGRVFARYMDEMDPSGELNDWGKFVERENKTNPATGKPFHGHFIEPERLTDDPASYMAGTPGPALPIVGSIAGEVAGIPGGLAGMAGGGAAGAAAGDTLRQGIARGVVGDTYQWDPTQAGIEAGIGAAGGALGRGMTAFKARKLASDFAEIDTPQMQAEIKALMDEAQARGIQLTPAEITDLPTLVAEQHALQNMPTSSPLIRRALKAREGKVSDAITSEIESISPVASARGSEMARTGAKEVIEELMARRTAQTSQIFDQAINESEHALERRIVVGEGVPQDFLREAEAMGRVDTAGGRRAAGEPPTAAQGDSFTQDQRERLRRHGAALTEKGAIPTTERAAPNLDRQAAARERMNENLRRMQAEARGETLPPAGAAPEPRPDTDATGSTIYRDSIRLTQAGDGSINVEARGGRIIGRRETMDEARAFADTLISNAEAKGRPMEPIRTVSKLLVDESPGLKIDAGDIYDILDRAASVAQGPSRGVLNRAANAFIVTRPTAAGEVTDVDVTLRGLFNTKKTLDGIVKRIENEQSGELRAAGALMFVKRARDKLVTRLRAASPEFERAMAEYERISPLVELGTEGLVGVASRRAPATDRSAPASLLNGTPRQIEHARRLFDGTGKLDQWNASLKSYLESEFNAAEKEVTPGSFGGVRQAGFNFFQRVMGDGNKKLRLRAAMSSGQFDSFERLTRVLAATGRVPQAQSVTAPLGEVMGQLRRRGGSNIANALNGLSRADITFGLGRWLDEISTGKYNRKLAEIIVSPNAMSQLDRLKQVSPGSKKAQAIILQFFMRFLPDEDSSTGAVVPRRLLPGENGAPLAPTSGAGNFQYMLGPGGEEIPFQWVPGREAWFRMDQEAR